MNEIVLLQNESGGQNLTVGEKRPAINPAHLYLATLSKGRSQQNVARILNQIARFFGWPNLDQCPWQRIGYPEIVLLKNRLNEEGKAPSTINLRISLLKGVTFQSWAQGLIDDHTWMTIKSIKGVRGSRIEKGRALQRKEMAKLVFHCEEEKTIKGIRDAAIFMLGAGCGFRRAEIVNLRLDGIDKVNRSVRVIGKGNRERLVLCSDTVWDYLSKWLFFREKALELGIPNVFCVIYKGQHIDTSRPLTESAVYAMLKNRAAESEVQTFTPHDLRRTFATRLFENGNDANIVRENMGHSSILTTQRYDKRDKERAQRSTREIHVI